MCQDTSCHLSINTDHIYFNWHDFVFKYCFKTCDIHYHLKFEKTKSLNKMECFKYWLVTILFCTIMYWLNTSCAVKLSKISRQLLLGSRDWLRSYLKQGTNRGRQTVIVILCIVPGIFAYLNYLVPATRKEILEILINGLKRLEYRGYDSAGKFGPMACPTFPHQKFGPTACPTFGSHLPPPGCHFIVSSVLWVLCLAQCHSHLV